MDSYLALDLDTEILQEIGSRNHSACRYRDDGPVIVHFSDDC